MMENQEITLLKNVVVVKTKQEQEAFDNLLDSCGVDKTLELYRNYSRITKEKKVDIGMLLAFLGYEYDLAGVLFTLLRSQEDAVKAFLCNTFNGYNVQISSRPSNYTKTKYYFKIPVSAGNFIDIRTFNYTSGPVDYYAAIKEMDFGDINLIMSKLDRRVLSKFSNNPNIISELDATRRVRNYVYHHNFLFAFEKEELEDGISFLIKNLPHPFLKNEYIKTINELRFQGSERDFDIGEKIAIYIDDDHQNQIFQKR